MKARKELFGIPMVCEPSIPKGMAFLMPSDIKASIDTAGAAQVMARHGIIPQSIADEIYHVVMESVVTAAKEKRIGVIKNLA